MAPKAKGKPASPATLVSCPSDGSPPDCTPLVQALQNNATEQASAVLSSLQQLPVTDSTASSLIASNITSVLIDALRHAEETCDWGSTSRELLFCSTSVLVRWRGSLLNSLASANSLEVCFKCIAEWGVVADEPATLPSPVSAASSPTKGKKSAPAPEQPKALGPPSPALAAAITWLAAAVRSSHDAAAWAASKMAGWYTALLRHPEPAVLHASCQLLAEFQRVEILRSALVQDGVAIYLWRLVESPPAESPTIAVPALHLLTVFVSAPRSTACLDLYDEHAIPRLVNMLTQPCGGLTRAEDGGAYQNGVDAGQPPAPLTAADVDAQCATATLLAELVRVCDLCCEQAMQCGLGYALLSLIPAPDTLPALQTELASLPPPALTPLPPRPSCCDPEGDDGDAAASDTGADAAARHMLSMPSGASDTASLAAASSLTSTASRRSSRRGSRRSFRTAASDVPQDGAADAASAAGAVAGAAAGAYIPRGFPEDPGQRPLPPGTIRAPAEAWHALQRLPQQPTRVPEVLAACVQMLRAMLAHRNAAAWAEAELWPQKTGAEWAALLCCLCFPELSNPPEPEAPEAPAVPEPPTKGGKGGKGKPAPDADASPPPLSLPRLLPPFSCAVRTAALRALEEVASDAEVMNMLRSGCLMHALHACMLPTDRLAEGVVAAAAPLLSRAVCIMVDYDRQREAYSAAVAEALKWQETILGRVESRGTTPPQDPSTVPPGSPVGSQHDLSSPFSRGSKSRRSTRSRSTAKGAAGCCPIILPAIDEPIPPPSHALELVAAACQAAEGLPVTVPRVAPVATMASGGSASQQAAGDMDVSRAALQVAEAAVDGGDGMLSQAGQRVCEGAGKLGGRRAFGPVARFEVARAAMAVPLKDYRPPPRPPLDEPPPTPPPEPLPINGYVWSAVGKTAMVVDGLDLSPDKLRELEERAALRAAAEHGPGDGVAAADGGTA
eukprot:jgi/Ulvmu1/9511/UM052_0084.1